MDIKKEAVYMDLYNKMFKFCYENYPLAFSEKEINEAMHIADGMDETAHYLADIVNDIINKYGTHNLSVYKTLPYEYTGLNFDKNYKQTLLSELNSGKIPDPIIKRDDESVEYLIYIQTEADVVGKRSTVYAWIDWREMDNVTSSKVFIHVNIAKFLGMNNRFRAQCLLVSTIAHELQHAFDMYILPHCNSLDVNKKAGSVISYNNDDFGLSKYDLKSKNIIYRLLSMISPEEINARLAELKSVLDIISSNPALANTMFYEKVMSKPVMSPPLALDMPPDYIYESDLLRNVGRNSLLRSISRIDIYKNDIDEIIKMKVENPDKYNVVMLILGFYLFKHNLLFLTGTADEKKSIRKLLGNKDNIMKVIDLETMTCRLNKQYDFIIETVYESVRKHFAKYVGEVHYRIAHHLPYLYNYKKVDEMLECSEISGAVILYPVV